MENELRVFRIATASSYFTSQLIFASSFRGYEDELGYCEAISTEEKTPSSDLNNYY